MTTLMWQILIDGEFYRAGTEWSSLVDRSEAGGLAGATERQATVLKYSTRIRRKVDGQI